MSKVWFVTGAGRGIGARVVNAALQAGHRVVATGRNLDTLRRAFPNAPADRIALVELDVANEQQASAAVDAAVERCARCANRFARDDRIEVHRPSSTARWSRVSAWIESDGS